MLIQVFNTLNYYGVAITTLATVAIGFFTLTLKLSTDRLWEAGEKQRRLYEETAKRQLRAYVHVTGAELSIHPHKIGGWMAHIAIKNFGQTPAHDMVVTVEKKIGIEIATDIVLDFSNAAFEQGESTLGPGSFNSLSVDFSEIPNDWINWARLREQNTKGYVWGRIDYIDAFNEPRWTTFQMIHHFAQINQFSYCLRGNDTEFSLRNSLNAVPQK